MSSIIEAHAYAQDFHASEVAATTTSAQLQTLVAFFIVMVVAAFAGVALSLPIVTIAAGLVTAAATVYASYSALHASN